MRSVLLALRSALMPTLALTLALALAPPAHAVDEDTESASLVQDCLACHIDGEGRFDIIGVRALEAMPAEWPLQFEDSYDLDGNGIAGQVQFVSGGGRPLIAKWGSNLAAARLEDFALIAAKAHDIKINSPKSLEGIKDAFSELSPDPSLPFRTKGEQARFEAAGCAACHVTRTFEAFGKTYMPLSDFLLHDMGGEKKKRTMPLWGCKNCLWMNPHKTLPNSPGKGS